MEDGAFPWAEIVRPLLDWYASCARPLPWRRDTEPYHILVSELMLQQTRVETVIPYYERFLRALPDLQSLADADEETLLKLWEGLGYYARARSLQKAARVICGELGGRFPDTWEGVRALPGVGDYTAGAVLSIAFGKPVPAADGNVARVASRLAGISASAADPAFRAQVAGALRGVYPAGACGEFTQSLMDLGAGVCLPGGAPRCGACPLAGLCRARRDGRQGELPLKTEKKPRPAAEKTVFLLRCGDRIAVRRRPEGGLLGGLWELPNADGALDAAAAAERLRALGVEFALPLRARPGARHVFTHLEWKLRCWEAACPSPSGAGLSWPDRSELERGYALPAAFRKLLPQEK